MSWKGRFSDSKAWSRYFIQHTSSPKYNLQNTGSINTSFTLEEIKHVHCNGLRSNLKTLIPKENSPNSLAMIKWNASSPCCRPLCLSAYSILDHFKSHPKNKSTVISSCILLKNFRIWTPVRQAAPSCWLWLASGIPKITQTKRIMVCNNQEPWSVCCPIALPGFGTHRKFGVLHDKGMLHAWMLMRSVHSLSTVWRGGATWTGTFSLLSSTAVQVQSASCV